jgi:Tol biopolymer transport system component
MPTHKRYLALVLVALLLGLAAAPGGRSASATQRVPAASRCFPETGFCLEDPFLGFWERNGGLPVFGYPVVELSQRELNRDTGATHPTQWLERYRFEAHPENQAPYDILLGRLGEQRLSQLGIDWRELPPAAGPQDGCLWFAETRHNVCDQAAGLGFKSYWQGHGLEFDGKSGASYAESLALFGLPLTEPRMETNASGDTVLTQWFERARFEWHPDKPAEYKVLLGLLGSELLNHQPLPGLAGRIAILQGPLEYQHLVVSSANGARQISLASELNNAWPVWSPDGRSLAFRQYADDGYDLYVIDAASGRRTLVAGEINGSFGSLEWSPDSRQILFDNHYNLYLADIDGSRIRMLLEDHPVFKTFWSPDGQQIAFLSWRSFSAGTSDIGIMRADGSDARIVRGNARFLAWSPDSTSFLFEKSEDIDPALVDTNLYLMNADGSGERQATSYPQVTYYSIKWRSNREIMLVYGADGAADCNLVKADIVTASQPTPLTTLPCQSGLAWSPNGRFLVFKQGGRLQTLSVDDGAVAPLNIDGYQPLWAPR